MLHAIWLFLADFAELILTVLFLLIIALFIYDRYVQRQHSLLINYPVIGRFRYFFEILREPMRQYFGDETFYESRDKVDWVYTAAKNKPNFMSFSVSQPFSSARYILKHSEHVLNNDELSDDITVTFGEKRAKPYVAKSPIFRSAMSDGALSPEAVRAFTLGSTKAGFALNTGEGGLTSNYFYTHKPDCDNAAYLEIVASTPFAEALFRITSLLSNNALAAKFYRKILLNKKTENTYIYDPGSHALFRVNWSAPLEAFPTEVPSDMPDLTLQIGSGLYGVRDENGKFDPLRYQKVMRFCQMTEIKIAQGAKQTGGKIIGKKVTADIAYYRGVEEGKDLISPNRFPFADTIDDLMDFIGELQELSQKPVGAKIVISDRKNVNNIAKILQERKAKGKAIPDFLTVDGGDGGSATAPLELMESVGMVTSNALYILDEALKKHDLREDMRIIASSKILTPDDVAIILSLGADAVGIARGFMMSAGCIRARVCSGTSGHVCPVGIATQDKKKRASFLVVKQGNEITNYHNNLIKGMKTILAIMGKASINELSIKNLTYINKQGFIFFDVDKYFDEKLKD